MQDIYACVKPPAFAQWQSRYIELGNIVNRGL
jgi:hypothetical protein